MCVWGREKGRGREGAEVVCVEVTYFFEALDGEAAGAFPVALYSAKTFWYLSQPFLLSTSHFCWSDRRLLDSSLCYYTPCPHVIHTSSHALFFILSYTDTPRLPYLTNMYMCTQFSGKTHTCTPIIPPSYPQTLILPFSIPPYPYTHTLVFQGLPHLPGFLPNLPDCGSRVLLLDHRTVLLKP